MKTKRTLTLLEIMIVIFLITIITGVIGYNMKGTLERGKAFRTERAKEQLHDLLLFRLADNGNMATILQNPKKAIEETGLAKNPDELMKDGWGTDFQIKPNQSKTDFVIQSENLLKYNQKNKKGKSAEQPQGEEDET